MSDMPLSPDHLRGIALTTVISSTFAAFWGISGSVALVGIWMWIAGVVVAGITLAFFIAASRFRRTAQHLPERSDDPSINPFRTRAYSLAIAAEVIAIPIAGRALSAAGRSDMIMPAIAAIVGLHFFGLIPAFRSWRFGLVGGAMVLLALLSLAIPPAVALGSSGEAIGARAAVVGFGCALILWGGILPLVMATRRQVAQGSA